MKQKYFYLLFIYNYFSNIHFNLMVEKVTSKIELSGALALLDSSEYNKVLFFIDKQERLNSFFTYKGRVVELNKLKLKIAMNKISKKDAEEELRNNIIAAAKMGEWLVFTTDKNSNFSALDFFKDFSFGCKGAEWFKTSDHLTREFYVKNKILKDDLDYDNFKNKGFWNAKSSFKMVFLSNCEDEDVSELMKHNSDELFNFVYIK